jgi:APA family basic amino acid/polyamine antiporter
LRLKHDWPHTQIVYFRECGIMNSQSAITVTATAHLPRKLGLLDATCIVIGTTIGAGIFLVPSSIARELPSMKLILAIWVVTGVISYFGALAYAELGAMMPRSGGQYVYLYEAYGPFTAFLCGWSSLLVIQSGSIATVAVGFNIYLSFLIPGIPGPSRWAPGALIALLTFINYRGIKAAAITQNVLTFLKVGGLGLLIASAFLNKAPASFEWTSALNALSVRQVVFVMVASFVAYDGWQYLALVAGEVRDPQRNFPLSLGLGVGAVILIYLLANLAYMKVLTLHEIAAAQRVATTAAERSMGVLGAATVTLTIVLSSAGAANGAIMTSPRIYFAQARDGLFFQKLAEIHPRFETPSFSILVQGAWTTLLALSGSYEMLFSYVMFASWFFHGMTVFGVLILRRKRPDLERPYKMWGYPLAPLLFVGFALWFVLNTLIIRPSSSLIGSLIITSGVPVYWAWQSAMRRLKQKGP